jgi:hypothetical protein
MPWYSIFKRSKMVLLLTILTNNRDMPRSTPRPDIDYAA